MVGVRLAFTPKWIVIIGKISSHMKIASQTIGSFLQQASHDANSGHWEK
jgi:hypothetical protein